MLDTVAFGFPVAPTAKQLESYNKVTHLSPRVKHDIRPAEPNIKYWNNLYIAYKKRILVIYYPQDVNGNPIDLLLIELSLPNVVFGNNFTQIRDLPGSIDRANHIISGFAKIPPVNLFHGLIYRIDPCYNYQVGEYVQDYVATISKLHYPHRTTNPYLGCGTQFFAKNVSCKFYDKELECGNLMAHGLLRHEITYRDRGRISKMIGNPDATILDFNNSWAVGELQKSLQALGLAGNPIFARDEALEHLKVVYGTTTGHRLFGYLVDRQSLTREQMATQSGKSITTILHTEEQIRKAGVPMVLTDRKVALPPLVINVNSAESPTDS